MKRGFIFILVVSLFFQSLAMTTSQGSLEEEKNKNEDKNCSQNKIGEQNKEGSAEWPGKSGRRLKGNIVKFTNQITKINV